ncbi:autophagy- protein 2, partial [Ascosphaera acerosa]
MTAATTTIVDDTQQDPVARMPGAFAASVMEAPGLRDAPLGQVVMESQLPPEAQDALDSAMTSARQLVQVPQVTLDLLSDDVQAQCTQQSAAAYPSASPPSAVMQASSTSTSPDFLASSLVAPGPSLQPQQPQSTADCTETLEVGKDSQRIEIVAPALKTQVDIPCSWLLAKWSVGLSTALARPPSSGTKTEAAKASRLPLKVDLQALDFRFATALPDISLENGDVRQGVFQPVTPMSNLVEMQLRAVHADCQLPLSSAPSTLTLARYTLRCGDRDFFRFSASMAQQQSRWQSNREPRRVDVRIVHEPEPGAARLSINTAPAVAMLDIAIVDELLTWVGGLSSILGQAGPNTPPSVAPTTVERSPRSRRRNIRFENDPMPTTLPPEGSMPEVAAAPVLKVNARVNGLSARLIGEACSIDLETSPLKLISRAGHIALQVDHARLSGPHNEQDTVHGTHQTVASVTNTRLEYLNQPEEADLDKLLALLTPSKDKFGPDDGLILDTLFRQRMQGPVLRLNVEKVAMQVPEASQLQALASIADDLDRLSRVAKYLPADDRPGILLVSRCQSVTVEVTLTDLLGNISISMTGAEIAHVALPPLSAGKVQTLKITRNGDITLLGPATAPPLGHEQSFDHSSPMIMARYLSEELEPTLTVKLFDCLLEYHIPTVLAFLGVNMDHADSEILKQRSPDTANAPSGFDEQASEGSQTTLGSHSARRVAIALRDCHIGLRCQHTPARGLLVLSSGQFHGSLEAGPLSQASLEVHRGSFLINDNITQQTPSSQRGKRHAIGDAHLQELCAQGFVLVASLSSTKLFATATRSSETLTSVIDAQLSDTLLILETCADSTQTLITLLNGLALPIPSVQGQKYRTEVVPIQEMLRSLGQESFRQTY